MLLFDIETDGLLDVVSTIHVIVIYDFDTGDFTRYDRLNRPISEGLERLRQADTIVGHNLIRYDIPAIKKLHPKWTHKNVLDTLVLGRLLFADIKESDFARVRAGLLPGKLMGSHSLEAYGYRLGEHKGDYGKTTDWKQWTPEMSDYCEQDVTVNLKLYQRLTVTPLAEQAVEIEHAVAFILARQERRGVCFDYDAAVALYQVLDAKREHLLSQLREAFPPFYLKDKEFTPKADSKKWGYRAGCPMTKVKLVKFNPASSQHIANRLIHKYKWVPTEFTENSGEPKVDETVLKGLPYPEAELLAEAMMLDKRIGQIATGREAWLKHYNPDTGRIHGYVNTNGAVTGRMTHVCPNLAQVPAVYSPYGKECRALFGVPKGYKLVGCDASGLEARDLAHFMARYDGGAYAQAVLNGRKEDGTDIHTLNMKALGIASRDDAKTWFYAFLYGAGSIKLGTILKAPQGEEAKWGTRAKKRFLKNLPALGSLQDAIQKKVAATKTLTGLDGRTLRIRSPHAAMNTLFQSAGAVGMKRAIIILDADLQALGLVPCDDYEFVLNIHDEWQIEVKDDERRLPERVGKAAVAAIQKAGEHFKFRCPLDGEYKIGDTWADTH